MRLTVIADFDDIIICIKMSCRNFRHDTKYVLVEFVNGDYWMCSVFDA